ncbi:3-hydroxyacyl-CoA dehydrogenase family protein [Profundibacterium mesophilum]|uniref:3-hydroxyacyl-CoA dehydrogenase n=1 Tax=Profundibacterium mesophilum KAUST100406-0324 TaxID=1037889 RepID=A0A921TED6_9RHOB|nr:3-hydroxyacyl-CoA dehydrogenase family protein [Profundibacterium mesophilum]KAF0677202.1 3-hydroxyacyl-CoA dehydrogenase [Profundibacterium mesophilum KAUST100406-0324]
MTVRKVAIIGAGTMGGGIAMTCLAAGLRVTVLEADAAQAEALAPRVSRFVSRAVEKGRMTREAADEALGALQVTDRAEAIAGSDLVIEAVFEDAEVKRTLFARIAPHLGPKTVLATNTSALRVDELARAAPDPERFIGLHYFSPAEVNPLVELVVGTRSSAEAVQTARAFLEMTGRTVLECRDAPGFVVNRFFCPYSNEAVRCLEDGIGDTAQIDAVACEIFGLPMGPFAVMNIIKPRVNLHALRNLSTLGALYEPAAPLVELGERGGAWDIAEAPSRIDAQTHAQIAARLRGATFLSILEALDEEVAEPDAFDLGAERALRFGLPPVAQMRRLGREETSALARRVADAHGAALPDGGLEAVFAG